MVILQGTGGDVGLAETVTQAEFHGPQFETADLRQGVELVELLGEVLAFVGGPQLVLAVGPGAIAVEAQGIVGVETRRAPGIGDVDAHARLIGAADGRSGPDRRGRC